MQSDIDNYLQLLGYGPEERRTIICQAAHESNYWQSDLYKKTFNMFGMKAHKRAVLFKLPKIYGGYATYQDFTGSLQDIADWHRHAGLTIQAENIIQYAAFLKKKKYYEDTAANYTAGMIRAYKILFPESAHKYDV